MIKSSWLGNHSLTLKSLEKKDELLAYSNSQLLQGLAKQGIPAPLHPRRVPHIKNQGLLVYCQSKKKEGKDWRDASPLHTKHPFKSATFYHSLERRQQEGNCISFLPNHFPNTHSIGTPNHVREPTSSLLPILLHITLLQWQSLSLGTNPLTRRGLVQLKRSLTPKTPALTHTNCSPLPHVRFFLQISSSPQRVSSF